MNVKKKAIGAVIAALALGLSVSACSTQKSAGGGATNAASTRPLVVATSSGGTTYTQNFNIFSPTGNLIWIPGAAFVYEPLLTWDPNKTNSIEPWLATSYKFTNDGKTLTFNLRKGVTWSDGKPFTAADVVFSLDACQKSQAITPGAAYDSAKAEGDSTVVVTFKSTSYTSLFRFTQMYMVPQHIWQSRNLKTWTNPTPVGTGPFTLSRFTPQAMFFADRSGYWGGATKGVQTIEIKAVSQVSSITSGINDNSIDWADWPLQNDGQQITSTPNHQYNFHELGTSEGPIFNTTQLPLSDVHVRLALRDAVDGATVAKGVGAGGGPASVTGLNPNIWDIPAPYNTPMKQDINAAKQELAAGGWTISGGNLVKGGKSYPLTYDVDNSATTYVTTAQLVAAQWKDALSLNVAVNQMSTNACSDAQSKGTFQITASALTYKYPSAYGVYALYSATNVKPIGQEAGSNFGRWSDPKTQSLLQQLTQIDPSDTAQQVALAQQIMVEVAQQAPFIPVTLSGAPVETNTTNWTGWPTSSSSYNPDIVNPVNAIKTVMNLSPVSK